MRENVLLLCLSKVSFPRKLYTYVYNDPKNGEIEVTGYMTNEPSAKVALNLVNLDRIVVICSKDVKECKIPISESITSEEENAIRDYIISDRDFPMNKEQYDKQIALGYTHSEYYETVISNYAKDQWDKDKKLEFCEVYIPNDPQEYEIAKAAVEAADKIIGTGEQSNTKDQLNETDTKKEVHLYIDFNGGPRYIASMLLSTANLIEQRGAVIDNIFTMNIDNKDEKGRVVVDRYMGVLQSQRLVSGIKEYIDYGRCKELANYFKVKGPETQIGKILAEMESLADNLQLCDAYRLFDKETIKALKQDLEDYKVQNGGDPFEILFEYVANDILEHYKPLFNGVLEDNLLDVIDWCLGNDYVQQAVTFYTERMPIYFWEKHIYYPTEEEEYEYKQIEEACNWLNEHKHEYESTEDIDQNEEDNEIPDGEADAFKRDFVSSEQSISRGRTKKIIRDLQNYFLNRDLKAEWMIEYLKNSYKYEFIRGDLKDKGHDFWKVTSLINDGRAQSIIETGELTDILNEYNQIKGQRNYINHADANGINSDRWTFDVLKDKLTESIGHIGSVVN